VRVSRASAFGLVSLLVLAACRPGEVPRTVPTTAPAARRTLAGGPPMVRVGVVVERPAVTLEAELLKIYYEERFERGFEYAFVVPGMTRVVQAAGRLIRSSEDTGVIALFDRRFTRRPYKDHLPPDWLGEGGVRELVGDPGEVARIFFLQPASEVVQ